MLQQVYRRKLSDDQPRNSDVIDNSLIPKKKKKKKKKNSNQTFAILMKDKEGDPRYHKVPR